MRRLAAFVIPLVLACQGPAGEPKKVPKSEPPPPQAKDSNRAKKAEARPAEPPYDGPPKTVLVELYSSQGCDSCPAADAFIGEFPDLGFGRDKVIPLTFHVTYWDDLGWQDPYAKPLYDQRQIGYAQNLPQARADDETTIRGPYTPQMVVDGKVHFSGTLKEVAKNEIEKARKAPDLIDIQIETSQDKNGVKVDVVSKGTRDGVFDTDRSKIGLFAAISQKSLETEVPRGENAGKKLSEHWVVRDFQGPKLFRSSREKNETHFDLWAPEEGEVQVVVFAQDLASMNIISVAAAPVGEAAVAAAGAP